MDWKREIESLNFDDDETRPAKMLTEFMADEDLSKITMAILIYATEEGGFGVSYSGMNSWEVLGMMDIAKLEIMDSVTGPVDAGDE